MSSSGVCHRAKRQRVQPSLGRGTLVYLANCADPEDYQGPAPQTTNARFGRRGDELVVRVIQQVGRGSR
eukprot:COSAG05_NODE_191_length_14617_cov_90.240736_7_plen_69_part_00